MVQVLFYFSVVFEGFLASIITLQFLAHVNSREAERCKKKKLLPPGTRLSDTTFFISDVENCLT